MFLREIFLSSKGSYPSKVAYISRRLPSSCALRKTHPKLTKLQQTLHELRHCTDLSEDCCMGLT